MSRYSSSVATKARLFLTSVVRLTTTKLQWNIVTIFVDFELLSECHHVVGLVVQEEQLDHGGFGWLTTSIFLCYVAVLRQADDYSRPDRWFFRCCSHLLRLAQASFTNLSVVAVRKSCGLQLYKAVCRDRNSSALWLIDPIEDTLLDWHQCQWRGCHCESFTTSVLSEYRSNIWEKLTVFWEPGTKWWVTLSSSHPQCSIWPRWLWFSHYLR